MLKMKPISYLLFLVFLVVPITPLLAQWQYPIALAVTQEGEVIIADKDLPGIWKYSDGKLEKYFEGSKKFRTPLNAVRSLAVDQQGRLLAGDSSTRELYRFDEPGKPVPLTEGALGIPMGIAVGPRGELYVSDLEVHYIWKIPAEGGKPEKVVQVEGVTGIALDDQQRLWAVSRSGGRLLRIGMDGQVETIVDRGVFQFPNAVLVKDGVAYVADGYGRAIWKVEPDKEPVKLAEGGLLRNPVAIAWKGDDLLIIDSGAKALLQMVPDGKITQLFPSQ